MLNEESAYVLTHELLSLPQPPSALIALTGTQAVGAYRSIQERGLRIPQDVALAGFSNEDLTMVAEPNLTSVDQRCEEMGQAAFRLFTDLVAAEGTAFSQRQVVLQPQLFVRESSVRRVEQGAK